MNDDLFKSQISHHLKSERQRKGLSLDATAKLTGVSKAMLGQIERKESSPTIATLWKITTGLETSFSAFFSSSPELLIQDKVFPEDALMKINTLFPYQDDTKIEVFHIELQQYHRQMSSPHRIGVIEHIHVLAGQLNVYFDSQWHLLQPGASIRFFADQPHGYEAFSHTTSFQCIICYPH